MTQHGWSQRELEDIFVRKDNDKITNDDFERRLTKIEGTLEWFQRLIIAQGVVLFVALIMFIVERVGSV